MRLLIKLFEERRYAPLFSFALLFLLLLAPVFAQDSTAAKDKDTDAKDTAQAAPPSADDALKLDSSQSSVTDALQGKEGMRIQTMCTHCNSANIQVGGLNQDLAPLKRDGFPLFGGLATSFVLSVLPPNTIAEAKVTKGPGEVGMPATAAGGLVELESATPAELPTIGVSAQTGSYRLRGGTIRAAGEMTDWLSGAATFGRTTVDPVDDDHDGWHDVSGLDRNFTEGELRFRIGRDHEITAAASYIDEESIEGRGGFDLFSYLFDPERNAHWNREDALIKRREYRAGWTWLMRSGGRLELKVLEATRDQKVLSQKSAYEAPWISNELENRLSINQVQRWGTIRYEQPIGLSFKVSGGIEIVHDRAAAVVKDSLVPVEEEYFKTFSTFADAFWVINPKWDLQFGLRHDDDEVFGAQTSPRATLRFSPGSGWHFRLISGRTFRAPKSIFSEVCCGQQLQLNVLEDGTILVGPEDAQTYGFEGIYQPSPEFKASVYLAQTDFDDHIQRVVGRSQSWIQTYANINIPESRAKTVEFATTWKPFSGLTLDGSIGFLDFNSTGDDPVALVRETITIITPVTIPMDQVPYRPKRSGSISASYRNRKGYSLAVSANYTGSMLIQQFSDDPLTGANILLETMRETPSFWLVGLSLDLPVHKLLDLSVGIDNITDEIQSDLGDPTTDYNWGPLAGRSWHLVANFHVGGH